MSWLGLRFLSWALTCLCLRISTDVERKKKHKTPWPKSKLNKKGFIGVILPHCSPSLKEEARTGTQSAFLYNPGMAPHTMGWALPYKSVIKKMFFRLIHNPILRRHFLNWGSLLSDDSRLCQVDINLVSTTWKAKVAGHVSVLSTTDISFYCLWGGCLSEPQFSFKATTDLLS